MKMTELPEIEGPKLSEALAQEIREFETWMRENLGAGLIPIEETILRTYLAWKIAPERFRR